MSVRTGLRALAIPGVIAAVAIGSYMWGWEDGRSGEGPALVSIAFAQQGQQQLVSPTAARDRDTLLP